MQAIVETLFDIVYLFSVITIGILMIRKSKGNRQFTMFVIMAVLLGSGDVFHLVPRAVALCTTGEVLIFNFFPSDFYIAKIISPSAVYPLYVLHNNQPHSVPLSHHIHTGIL